MEKSLKPIKIKVFYNEEIKKITGKDREEAMVSENLTFVNFLNFIFSSHPNIPKIFLPGTIGLLLNGVEPREDDILKDGDLVKFIGMKIEDIRKIIENQISEIIRYHQINTTFDGIKKSVFNENGQKDFNELSTLFTEKTKNIDEANMVLQIVNNVWNYFPHKSLNGFCPMEKILEFQEKQKK